MFPAVVRFVGYPVVLMPEDTTRLADARAALDRGDLDAAAATVEPLTRHPDPGVSGEAWLLIGTARYRADDEPGAMAAWRAATEREGPVAWLGWRSVAEQLVREGELADAVAAYREADRRAPPQERGAIANRIAWLLKETGHDFAARRQFNRARGAYAAHVPIVTYAIIAICSALFRWTRCWRAAPTSGAACSAVASAHWARTTSSTGTSSRPANGGASSRVRSSTSA
jgi:tetratricopeptide (TPR) repeat protein